MVTSTNRESSGGEQSIRESVERLGHEIREIKEFSKIYDGRSLISDNVFNVEIAAPKKGRKTYLSVL